MKKNTLISLLLLFFFSCSALATETIEDAGEKEEIPDQSTQQVEGSPPAETIVEPNETKKQIAETFSEDHTEPFQLIGHQVEPGKRETLHWSSLQSPLGKPIEVPIIIINGSKPGPTLLLTAAIHGDELNGIEIIRRTLNEVRPKKLKGVIIGIPIINLEGFWRKDRYIGDRRDLNRYFPGNPEGSYPARIAHTLFTSIVTKSDMVVDLHTGSFFRENLPQLRVDLTVPQIAELATGFGAVTALQSTAPKGSLRGAATAAGIPAIVMEIGGPLSLEEAKVETGVKSLQTFLQSVGMIDKITLWPKAQPVFYGSKWVRADVGGILFNKVKLGESVKENQLLAEISNPLDNTMYTVHSPIDGTVLGRAQNQFVSPGFALFHLGYKRSVKEITEEVEQESGAQANRE